MVSSPIQKNQTLSVTYGTDGTKIASGSTTPGATNWQYNAQYGIYVDVDTSAAGFTTTPLYFSALSGELVFLRIGGSSPCNQTAKGFRVYISESELGANPQLNPNNANHAKWHINWMAIEPAPKTPFPDPQKYYYLIAKHSGKGLAVAGFSNDNNAHVVQWDLVAQDHFKFNFQDAGDGYFYIVAKHSGKGIAVLGVSNDNGANVVQWDLVAQDNYKFHLQDAGDGYFYIVAKHSGKGIAVLGASNDNGANVVQWEVAAYDNYKWRFEAV